MKDNAVRRQNVQLFLFKAFKIIENGRTFNGKSTGIALFLIDLLILRLCGHGLSFGYGVGFILILPFLLSVGQLSAAGIVWLRNIGIDLRRFRRFFVRFVLCRPL